MAPTEAGAALLARLGPALARSATAVGERRRSARRAAGPLRINAPEPAVELVLAPHDRRASSAATRRARWSWSRETSLVDIVAGGFDAGVRWGEDLAQDMIAVLAGGDAALSSWWPRPS